MPSRPPFLGQAIIFRLGLAVAGSLLIHTAYVLSLTAPLANTPLNVALMIGLGSLGLWVLVTASLCQPPHSLRWLILGTYVIQIVVQSIVWARTSRLPDLIVADSGLYTDLAGELIRRGENPYTWDYGGVYDLYRTRQDASTPRLNSAPESNYPYPALPILLVVPFQTMHLPGVFSVSIIAHAVLLALVFATSPREWQPVVLAPLLVGIHFAGFDFASLTLIGNLDIVWVLALVGMMAAWRRPTLRAVLFGIAVSLKQGPVLLAPFLLIRIWRDEAKSFERATRFILISAATFFTFNGPFILWNPVAWFEGCAEPLRDTLVILSQGGLSTLTQIGIAYLPKSFFLFTTLAAFGLAIFVYWRHYDSLRDALWILPGITMWFSFRSLVSYWLYWVFPMSVAVVRSGDFSHLRSRTTQGVTPKRSWKPTLAVALGALVTLFALGAVMSSPTAPVQIRLRLPMLAGGGRIERLSLDVTNQSSETLTPRYAIQSLRTVTNPLPWYIEKGPLTLAPGESAAYVIGSTRADRSFFAQEAAQIVVTDAGGNYSLRGVLAVSPDPSYLWPDAIVNADYRVWNSAQTAPLFWIVAGSGSASPANYNGRDAVRLSINAASDEPRRVKLDEVMLFPRKSFGVWLYPLSADPSIAYGLEVDDGERRLWILFGPQTYTGPVDDGVFVINRFAPTGAWAYEEIDLQAAYAEAGWLLPPLHHTVYFGFDMDAQVINLRLLFDAGRSAISQAYFGPIVQGDYRVAPQTLMAETLADPAAYYARLAEAYLRERNPAHALESYERALSFAPANADILKRIESVKRMLVEEEGR